jgi:beta-lactam-binding protein with PASTA domain
VQGYKAAQVSSFAAMAAAVYKGCIVPNVVGKSLSAAKKRITGANCLVGKVSYVLSAKGRGKVVSQRPKAKSHVAYGTKVSLIVSESKG